MPNPVQIQQLFQKLIYQFENSVSIRYRYHIFRNFVKELEGEYKRYESYISHIIADLPLYGLPVTWSGIDPDELEDDLDLFATLISELPALRKSTHFKKINERLHEVCVYSYSCLNEFEVAEKHLEDLTGCRVSSLSKFAEVSSEVGIKILFKYLIHEIQILDREIKKLNSLKKEVQLLIEKKIGKVMIPVVEDYVDNDEASSINSGRLRRISIELYSESKSEDELSRSFNVYGIEEPTYLYKREVLNATRKLLRERTNKLNNTFFKGLISYELTGALHDGTSANLAISALWYSALLKKTGNREKFIINPDAAITGDVESDGKVVEISSESIYQKTKAAFFSWIDVLVVPQSQKTLFEREIEKLQNKYPSRSLDVVGANKLEDLFYDRRVTDLVRTNLISQYYRNVSEKIGNPVSAAFSIVLLGIIIALITEPRDRNPASFSFEGNYLVLANNSGSKINKITVDAETAHYQSTQRDIEVNPLAVLADITNDGQNELIWTSRGNRADEQTSVVSAWSVSGDSLIWQKELKLNYNFPRQSALLETGLRSNQIGYIETDRLNKIVINASSNIYFQNVVFLLNVQNGEIISEYVHIGQLRAMILADLTGNGVNEIILTGINNAFWNAAIVVLEANNAQGHSPLTEDYKPEGIHAANEFAYILVPKTPIGEYLSSIEKYNQGRYIFFDNVSESIWFQIAEGRRYFRDYNEDIFTILYFDRTMTPIGVGTNDLYDIISRELYEEGEIPFIPGYEYFEAYQDSLLYWDGEGFQKAMNFFSEEKTFVK
ncbi:MAG: hypothetical protein JJU13_13715 [Balneolaceae bacterium]|nr:hypothetical protein [Balneolaceae bacterium]